MSRSSSGGSSEGAGTRFGVGVLDVEPAPERYRPRLTAGDVIDAKYRLERPLGEGGMGVVWCAHHLQLDLPVAIKLLRPAAPDQRTLTERLKLEARASARLVHPAIVRVFDIDTSEHGEPFIVMELLEGESLADLLDRGRLSPVSAVQIMLPIAEALALAHSKGIVHRDLKPHNVFLTEGGDNLQPKLLDFGIAKLSHMPFADGSLTATGVMVGSPDYMSPEQARGLKDVDYRADVWSFAIVLYECLSGRIPFEGDNYNALMRAIVEEEPAPLPIDEALDEGLVELIRWGLAKDRTLRPSSMQEFGRELARWLLDRGVKEDVCGNQLGPRWITRTGAKAAPVLLVDAPEMLDAAEAAGEPYEAEKSAPAKSPSPPVRSDTLVSARGSTSAAASQQVEPEARVSSHRPRWAIVAGVMLLGAGVVWALSSAGPKPSSPASAGAASLAAPATPLAATAARATVEIAPTPPAPAVVAEPNPVVSDASKSVTASPSAVPGLNSRAPAESQVETRPKPPATKPGRDKHDETHELLQAY